MPLPPSRRDTIGPPPRDVSDLAALVRHQGSYLRSLDPGLLGGTRDTPRPVNRMGAQLVGSDQGGDGGQDIAFWNTDRVTVTVAGHAPLPLTFEPIDGSLTLFWGTDAQPPTEYTLDADAQLITFTNPHIHVDDVVWATYAYYPTDLVEPDPSAWYRLDEAVGDATMHDSSGNAHDGSYTAVTLQQPSLLTEDADPAAFFNGTTAHAQVPFGGWMNTPEISVAILLKGTSKGTLVARDNTSLGRLWALRIGSTLGGDGTNLGFVPGGVFFNAQITASGPNLKDGNRHMAGFSYNGSTLRLVVDGVVLLTQALSIGYSGDVPLTIGGAQDGSGGSFVDLYTGVLDECRVYPKVLTDSEWSELWSAS